MARQITLDDFFRVRTEVELPNGVKVVIRTLSEQETQSRRRMCALASSEISRELRNKDSELYAEYMEKYDTSSREEDIESIRTLKYISFMTARRDQSRPEIIVMPDDATPEEEANVIRAREEAEEKWRQEIIDGANADIEAFIKSIENMSDEEIKKIAKETFITSRANSEYYSVYENATIFYSCEKDGKRMFQSINDVLKLNPEIREKLLTEYNEVSGIDVWRLEDFFGTGS